MLINHKQICISKSKEDVFVISISSIIFWLMELTCIFADFMVNLSETMGVRCLDEGTIPVIAIGAVFHRYATAQKLTKKFFSASNIFRHLRVQLSGRALGCEAQVFFFLFFDCEAVKIFEAFSLSFSDCFSFFGLY